MHLTPLCGQQHSLLLLLKCNYEPEQSSVSFDFWWNSWSSANLCSVILKVQVPFTIVADATDSMVSESCWALLYQQKSHRNIDFHGEQLVDRRTYIFTGRLPWQPAGIKFTQCISGQKSPVSPLQEKLRWIEKWFPPFRIVTTFSISMLVWGRSNYEHRL